MIMIVLDVQVLEYHNQVHSSNETITTQPSTAEQSPISSNTKMILTPTKKKMHCKASPMQKSQENLLESQPKFSGFAKRTASILSRAYESSSPDNDALLECNTMDDDKDALTLFSVAYACACQD